MKTKDKELGVFDSIRLIALRDALAPEEKKSIDYRLRYIMRWYSKTFHTPLHQVYDLPVEELLRVYFEEKYDAMEPSELFEELNKIFASPEKEQAEQDAREADDEAFFQEVLAEARQLEEEQIKKKEQQVVPLPQDEFSLSFDDLDPESDKL